jgi:osmotically-inducible protein OsmY
MSPATDLQDRVLRELRFDPRVEASKIGVTATPNGTVTLTGTVNSYTEKLAAEEAAKRVAGVRAVANDIEVVLPGTSRRSDTAIAEAALNALKSRATPLDNIKVIVKNGWVTLEGEVEYYYQKQEAERAVSVLAGVTGVTNNIRVRPVPHTPKEEEVKKEIEDALIRSARLDARSITVEVRGTKVILRGSVRSWAEREEAENAAWAVPGVLEVENRIEVTP